MPIYLTERRTKAERTQQTLKVCVMVYLIWKTMLSAYITSSQSKLQLMKGDSILTHVGKHLRILLVITSMLLI